MSMYYADGGPGPATKLFRVDAPDGCSDGQWRAAQAFRWTPNHGWFVAQHVQLDIRQSGELFLVDDSEVPTIQQQLRENQSRPAWFM